MSGKNKQVAATIAAVTTAVDWDRQGLDLQAIIEAGNQGKLSGPLTEWFVSQGWVLGNCVQQTPAPKQKIASSIFGPMSTVVIPATARKFVAKDKFVVNTERNGKMLISEIGSNFRLWFLKDEGKIEDPIAELTTLNYAKLRKASKDGPVIKGLGGEAKAETTLSEMFFLMEKQKCGEGYVLLNSGYANIFYIKDQNGVLRTVYVRWLGGGWDVHADSVEGPSGWGGGDRVFSRNFVLEPSETSA